MHRQILPIVNKIHEVLELKDIEPPQEFAIGFLIRGYIISTVTYLVESLRNQADKPMNMDPKSKDYMLKIKPIGTA